MHTSCPDTSTNCMKTSNHTVNASKPHKRSINETLLLPTYPPILWLSSIQLQTNYFWLNELY